MKKIINIIIILLSLNSINAQSTLNVSSVDKKTYTQYLAKNWNELIKTGKNAIKNNIDFYYLNYRLGIAYYKKKNYATAIKYFKKTYDSNLNDDIVKEYLYYSYLLSGRYDDAKLFSSNFSDKMKAKLGLKLVPPFISAIQLSGKFDMVDDYFYTPELDDELDQIVVQKQSWYSFGIEHIIKNKTTLMYNFSKTNIENLIYNTDNDLPQDYIENLKQNQYYFAVKHHFGNGFNTSLGLHYLRTEFYAPTSENTRGFGNANSYNLYSYKINSFAASLKISKSVSLFNTTFETSIANLNDKTQIQPSLSIRIYPFGNDKFYSETKGIYISETDGNLKNSYNAIKQSFGFKIKKYSFISPSLTLGELTNYTDYNAFIVNNDADKTKLKFTNYINFGFNKGYSNIFINYSYNIKENSFKVNNFNKNIEYNSQEILLGLKLYF